MPEHNTVFILTQYFKVILATILVFGLYKKLSNYNWEIGATKLKLGLKLRKREDGVSEEGNDRQSWLMV